MCIRDREIEAEGDTEGLTEAEGDTLALGLTEGDADALGLTLADGDTLGLAELDGDTDGEAEGLSDADGEILADGLPVTTGGLASTFWILNERSCKKLMAYLAMPGLNGCGLRLGLRITLVFLWKLTTAE